MTNINDTIEQIKAERRRLWETEGKPLADIAATRSLSAEETQTWERVNADFDAAGQRISAMERAAAQERAFAAAGDAVRDLPDETVSELRAVLVERTRESMQLRFTGQELTRALASGTASAGGNTIPTTFLSQLIEPLRDLSSVLAAGATIITTESGEDIKIPTLATPGAAVANVAESATRAGTDPTFGQLTLKAYEHAQLINAPRRLVEDSAVDIEGLVARLIAENIGVSLAGKLATGAGTTETAGIATAATAGKTGATGVFAPTFDDVIDLFHSVSAPYRASSSAAFLASDGVLASLRKLKATGTGEYLWQPSVQVGQPDLILGKPVYPDANIAAPAAGAKSLIFGDISRYWVRFVNSIEIARSDHANFATNGVAFRGLLRADGLLTDASAAKAFVGGAAA